MKGVVRLSRRRISSLSDYSKIDGITYKIANTKSEREESFKLVYDSYLNKNLISENSNKMRLLSHHLNPMTDIFIAKKDEEILYTVTLITDDSFNIPMESVFPQEIDNVRKKYKCISELSSLAGKNNRFDNKSNGFKIYTNLLSLVAQFSRRNEIDCFPCIHDFAKLDIDKYKMYDKIYGNYSFYNWELLRQPMKQEERNYFSQFLTKDKEFTLFSSE
jgi:hypothetical protein